MYGAALKIFFLAIFLQIVIKEPVAQFMFIKIPCFQHFFPNTLRLIDATEAWGLFFETHLILDI